MKLPVLFTFLCVLLKPSLCIWEKFMHRPDDQVEFCYEENSDCVGPSNWPGQCQIGQLQSPIDFDDQATNIDFLSPPLFRKFYFHGQKGSDTSKFSLKHNGHSIEVFFPVGAEPVLKGVTLDLPDNYKFVMMHFHWGRNDWTGTEHTNHGQSGAMELHMVHYNVKYENYSSAAESNDPHAVTVIGILYDVAIWDNLSLKPITDLLPAVREYSTKAERKDFGGYLNLKALFPSKLSFYRYIGSQTTPNCLENQIWTVFKFRNQISRRQLQQFRRILSKDNSEPVIENHRPTQPRNGRPIKLYIVPANFFDGLTQFCANSGVLVRQFLYKALVFIGTTLKLLSKPIFVDKIVHSEL